MPQVLGDEYNPNKRKGRPYSVDISYFKTIVDNNPGKWVSDVFTPNEAASVRRQFSKFGDYEITSTKANEPGKREVVIRRING